MDRVQAVIVVWQCFLFLFQECFKICSELFWIRVFYFMQVEFDFSFPWEFKSNSCAKMK